MLQKLNIKQKLILIQVGTVFTTLLIVGILLLAYQNKSLKDNKVINLNSIGHVMAYNVVPVLQFKDPTSGKEILSTLRSEELIEYAAIYSDNGFKFCEYLQEGIVLKIADQQKKIEVPEFSKNNLTIQIPIVTNGELLGTLEICSRLDDIKSTFQYYIYVYALSFVIIVLFTLVIASIFQKIITSPIQNILGTVRKISRSKEYSERITVTGNDELAFLANEFNTMIHVIDERNSQLESTVNQRTESLKNSNAELKTQIETVNKFIKEQKDFTYVASHDLKTPIRSISSLANFISEDLGENTSDEIKNHLQMIHLKANKLQNIIDGVLTFLRIDKEKEKSKELNFDAFLSDIIEDSLTKHDCTITYDDEIGIINTQYDSLKLIVSQLIENGITFNKNENKTINIDCERTGSKLILSINDNGEGIEEQYFNKIFEPFRYLSKQGSSQNIGIGLSLVKKLVNLNGGEISLTSEINVGTTFKITWLLN